MDVFKKLTPSRIAAPALFALWLSFAGPVANAQCVECANQMLNAWTSSVVVRGAAEMRLNDYMKNYGGRSRDDASGSPSGGAVANSGPNPDIQNLLQDAVMPALNAEARRRAGIEGSAQAQQWMLQAARAMGHQTGLLRQEYVERARSQGRKKADAWYLATARSMSVDYVRGSH